MCQDSSEKRGKWGAMNMKKKNRSYNMLTDSSYEDIHMCRINISHTICIWGDHIFDTNFKKTLPLNNESLLICRSMGMPDDAVEKLNLQSCNDNTQCNKYIDCWKFTIPKQCIHIMNMNKKKLKHIQEREKSTKTGKMKNDENYE